MLEGQAELATQQQEYLSKELLDSLESQRNGWQDHQEAIQKTYLSMEGKFEGLDGGVVGTTDWHDKIKDVTSQNLASWQAALTVQEGLTATIADERTQWWSMLKSLEATTDSIETLRTGLEALAVMLKQDIEDMSTERTASGNQLEGLANHWQMREPISTSLLRSTSRASPH